jgi:hypothetical protein
MTIPVVGLTVCVPPDGLPGLPALPPPPNVPIPPTPPVPIPPTPPLPVPGAASAAAVGSGCHFQAQKGTSPTEQIITTLPDGGQIYTSGTDPTSLSGYGGVTGPHGILEASGSVSTAGVQGQVGGHSNDAPLDGYVGSSGICVNGNSVP